MNKLEKLEKKLKQLNEKHTNVIQDLNNNEREIRAIEDEIAKEKNSSFVEFANNLLNTYIKVECKNTRYRILRIILVKNLTPNSQYNEFYTDANSVCVYYDINTDDIVTYTYDNDAEYTISSYWDDPVDGVFIRDVIEKSSESEFNEVKSLINKML